jgi:alpha-methylacyl-CoA racemase
MSGPLEGIKIIELAGQGALPFGSLKLADMGADVVRVERADAVPAEPVARPHSSWDRGRRSIAVDLKNPEGTAALVRLVENADVFLESFRPGVAERLGLGPEDLLAANPRLVYGRLTGWGQTGPLAKVAGHSLNYEALTGVIRAIGPAGGSPIPLLQLLGDFGGGGMQMAYGVVCAYVEAQRTGRGQVVDVAMAEGVMSLAAVFYGMSAAGFHTEDMGTNLFDGGAPYYAVYECSDGRWVTLAPIEDKFYDLFLRLTGLDVEELPDRSDRANWPALKARFAELFATRTRDEWCAELEGTDVCFAPVLTFDEARQHPQIVELETFVDTTELRPIPRLANNSTTPRPSPAWPGADTDAVFADFGFTAEETAALRTSGAIA